LVGVSLSNKLQDVEKMPSRRQEKVARIVREVVSRAISTQLSDPRIVGIVSVTRVEMAPDLRAADVYLSIFESSESQEQKVEAHRKKTLSAINHARSFIQSLLADRLESKFCPVLHFHSDEKYRKTMEVIKLIDQVSSEFDDSSEQDRSEESED
jgi:ribosome-binding factor A